MIRYKATPGWNTDNSSENLIRGLCYLTAIPIKSDVYIFNSRGEEYEISPPPGLAYTGSDGSLFFVRFIDLREPYMEDVVVKGGCSVEALEDPDDV